MGLFSIVLSVFLTVIWIIVIVKMILKRFGRSKYEYATVVSKSDDNFQEYSIVQGYALEKAKYVVGFETKHKTIKLFVSQGFFHSVNVNDTGMLEYKGSYLIDFEKGIGIEDET